MTEYQAGFNAVMKVAGWFSGVEIPTGVARRAERLVSGAEPPGWPGGGVISMSGRPEQIIDHSKRTDLLDLGFSPMNPRPKGSRTPVKGIVEGQFEMDPLESLERSLEEGGLSPSLFARLASELLPEFR